MRTRKGSTVMRHPRTWLLLAAVLFLAACGSAAAPTTVRTEVSATELSFTPTQVTAKVGQQITVSFANVGAVEHDWAVMNLPAREVHASGEAHGAHDEMAPEVHVAAKPGGRAELTFTPDKAGRYTIVCTVPGHADAGMMGMLTVVN